MHQPTHSLESALQLLLLQQLLLLLLSLMFSLLLLLLLLHIWIAWSLHGCFCSHRTLWPLIT